MLHVIFIWFLNDTRKCVIGMLIDSHYGTNPHYFFFFFLFLDEYVTRNIHMIFKCHMYSYLSKNDWELNYLNERESYPTHYMCIHMLTRSKNALATCTLGGWPMICWPVELCPIKWLQLMGLRQDQPNV